MLRRNQSIYPSVCESTEWRGTAAQTAPAASLLRGGTLGKDAGEAASVLYWILAHTECPRMPCPSWLPQVVSLWIIYGVISL